MSVNTYTGVLIIPYVVKTSNNPGKSLEVELKAAKTFHSNIPSKTEKKILSKNPKLRYSFLPFSDSRLLGHIVSIY